MSRRSPLFGRKLGGFGLLKKEAIQSSGLSPSQFRVAVSILIRVAGSTCPVRFKNFEREIDPINWTAKAPSFIPLTLWGMSKRFFSHTLVVRGI